MPLRRQPTFNFQVVSPETVCLKVQGQGCVGMVQENLHLVQLNSFPLKYWHQCVPAEEISTHYYKIMKVQQWQFIHWIVSVVVTVSP